MRFLQDSYKTLARITFLLQDFWKIDIVFKNITRLKFFCKNLWRFKFFARIWNKFICVHLGPLWPETVFNITFAWFYNVWSTFIWFLAVYNILRENGKFSIWQKMEKPRVLKFEKSWHVTKQPVLCGFNEGQLILEFSFGKFCSKSTSFDFKYGQFLLLKSVQQINWYK